MTVKLNGVETVLTPEASEGCGIEAVNVMVQIPSSELENESIKNDFVAPSSASHAGYAIEAAF